MKLWLLRHGEAAARARSDAERPLTGHGVEQVIAQARAHLSGQRFTDVLVSPYLRAQQTAALVAKALEPATLLARKVDWITPDDEPRKVLRMLDSAIGDNILLVSHNPLLGALAGLLVHGNLQQPLALGTASLVELEGELLAGAMTLKALHHAG
ncbi:phosphohistidine phosphatase SixA [Pseudomonas sp. LRF_L74]|uniref:phosphohistidine phosphatase SixA n=1 Tax=Pseudomonas sp. LRF_L74 TaxID=3369422 RepID=UPI003F5DC390